MSDITIEIHQAGEEDATVSFNSNGANPAEIIDVLSRASLGLLRGVAEGMDIPEHLVVGAYLERLIDSDVEIHERSIEVTHNSEEAGE